MENKDMSVFKTLRIVAKDGRATIEGDALTVAVLFESAREGMRANPTTIVASMGIMGLFITAGTGMHCNEIAKALEKAAEDKSEYIHEAIAVNQHSGSTTNPPPPPAWNDRWGTNPSVVLPNTDDSHIFYTKHYNFVIRRNDGELVDNCAYFYDVYQETTGTNKYYGSHPLVSSTESECKEEVESLFRNKEIFNGMIHLSDEDRITIIRQPNLWEPLS